MQTQQNNYLSLRNAVLNTESQSGSSPLAKLLELITQLWRKLNPTEPIAAILTWLEQVSLSEEQPETESDVTRLIDSLDLLINDLIVENQEPGTQDTLWPEIEALLANAWQKTYAAYCIANSAGHLRLIQARARGTFREGSDAHAEREKVYSTGLSPLQAAEFFERFPELLRHLQSGADYYRWNEGLRIQFFASICEFFAETRILQGKTVERRLL